MAMVMSKTLEAQLRELADECRKDIQELDDRIADLREKREALQQKMDHATGLLSEGEARPSKGYAGKRGPQNDIPGIVSGGKATEDMTFRAKIRLILGDAERPLRPAEVAKRFKKSGFEYSGTTALVTRVNNDLSRMYKSGQLMRDKRGYWLWQNEDNQ